VCATPGFTEAKSMKTEQQETNTVH